MATDFQKRALVMSNGSAKICSIVIELHLNTVGNEKVQ